MVISKIISVDEMKEPVMVKDLSYFDVSNMLQEKNSYAKGISEKSEFMEIIAFHKGFE